MLTFMLPRLLVRVTMSDGHSGTRKVTAQQTQAWVVNDVVNKYLWQYETPSRVPAKTLAKGNAADTVPGWARPAEGSIIEVPIKRV